MALRSLNIRTVTLAALAAFMLVGLTPTSKGDEPVPGTDPKVRGSEGIVANGNLAGTWNLIRSVNQGAQTSKDKTSGSEVIVRENEISVFDADKNELYRCEYKTDTSATPATITMKSTTPGAAAATALGIYKIDGGKWTLCYALPGHERPERFKSTEEAHTMLMVMRRPK